MTGSSGKTGATGATGSTGFSGETLVEGTSPRAITALRFLDNPDLLPGALRHSPWFYILNRLHVQWGGVL